MATFYSKLGHALIDNKVRIVSEGKKMKASHTPGPWNVKTGEGAHHRDLYIRGPKNVGAPHNVAVARICSYSNSRTECAANASLIAAAPDLLEALKDLCDSTRGTDAEWSPAHERAKAAIAKAEEIAK